MEAFRATPMEIVYLLIGFPRIVCYVLGLYYYKSFGKSLKKIYIITAFLMVFLPVYITGHQKNIGDVVIFWGSVWGIIFLGLSDKEKKKIMLNIGVGVGILLLSCSYIQIKRMESIGINGIDELNQRMPYYAFFDANNWFFKLFGKTMGIGLAGLLTGYITGGYYGLSRCLQLPFKFTWGLSFFSPLAKIVYMLTGYNGLQDHYVTRMSEKYDINGFQNWHSVFPYLAGDITFPGTIIFFTFVGYLWGKCWKEILTYRNPLSILMFCQLNIGLIFIPSNNQILWGIDSNMAFWILFYIWGTRHKQYNRLNEVELPHAA